MFKLDVKKRQALNISDFEFLRAFKKENELTFFRIINEVTGFPKNESCLLSWDEDEYPYIQGVFRRHQRKNCAIYFVVNSGGQKKDSIDRINAHFCDFDFRKYRTDELDENGKPKVFYRTDNDVEVLKQTCLVMLQKFKLEPSIINETKNGFHVYWLVNLKSSQVINKFRPLQEALIKFLDTKLKDEASLIDYANKNGENEFGDFAVKDLSRVMRVPGYMHLKNPNEPFKVITVKFNPTLTYSQSVIAQAIQTDFKTLISEEEQNRTKKNNNRKEKNISGAINGAEVVTNVKNVSEAKENIIIYNYADLFDYLKKQDLREYLGVNVNIKENFKCLFHNDTNPSATISITQDNYYKYHCFSSSCEYANHKGLDVIDIVIKQRECSFQEAVDYLIKYYDIKFEKTEWMKKQQDKYIINLTFLSSSREREDFKEKYPNLANITRYAMLYLRIITNIGLVNIKHEGFSYNGESVFYASNRFIMIEAQKDNVGQINKYINLLATLGLINKVQTENVPGDLFKRAEQERKKNGQEDVICFYTVPNFYDVFKEAERRATIMKKSGFTIKSMGKRYLINVFGEEFANQIYGYQISLNRTEKKRNEIERMLLIDLKTLGYFSFQRLKKKKILLKKHKYEDGKISNIYMSEVEKKVAFRIVAPRLMNKYGLKKKKANNELKKRFNLAGYYEIMYSETGTIF